MLGDLKFGSLPKIWKKHIHSGTVVKIKRGDNRYEYYVVPILAGLGISNPDHTYIERLDDLSFLYNAFDTARLLFGESEDLLKELKIARDLYESISTAGDPSENEFQGYGVSKSEVREDKSLQFIDEWLSEGLKSSGPVSLSSFKKLRCFDSYRSWLGIFGFASSI